MKKQKWVIPYAMKKQKQKWELYAMPSDSKRLEVANDMYRAKIGNKVMTGNDPNGFLEYIFEHNRLVFTIRHDVFLLKIGLYDWELDELKFARGFVDYKLAENSWNNVQQEYLKSRE
jgi:hypothetical protein